MNPPPSDLSIQQCQTAVDWAIATRRTEKVLSDRALLPTVKQLPDVRLADQAVRDAVAIAGWAPFHYDRNLKGVSEPWRMQVLLHKSCRNLSRDFTSIVSDLKPGNKLPAMMNACGALILVSWLPQASVADESKREQTNQEHLAATSAAVQNLLLALQSRGLGTYWSSGGPLGSTALFEKLGVSSEQAAIQKLAAAIFVDYPFLSAETNVQRIPGKNLAKRGQPDRWMNEVAYE